MRSRLGGGAWADPRTQPYREMTGNIWSYYDNPANWIVITTNGFVRNDRQAVMGRGTALQAAHRFPAIMRKLGDRIKEDGNHVFVFAEWRLITMPVKHNWWEPADLMLIKRSVDELLNAVDIMELGAQSVYLPRPGCGNGRLTWEAVKPLLTELDGRFTVVDLAAKSEAK